MARKKRAEAASDEPQAQEVSTAQAERWTNGSVLGSKGVTWLLGAALLCGPVALIAFAVQPAPVISAPAVEVANISETEQAAGAYASGLVTAWLSATRDDSAALEEYLRVGGVTFGASPFEYRNVVVASLELDRDKALARVVVGAEIRDAAAEAAGEISWPRRYFQVEVSTAGEALAAVTLPSPVTGPATAAAPPLQYVTTLSATDPAGQTVMSFLTAYMAGQGEVERYTSPDAAISAISPAQFVTVSAVALASSERLVAEPADGSTAEILATVMAETVAGQRAPATYALVLTARAGRWEISALGSAPLLSAAPEPSQTINPSSAPADSSPEGTN